MVAVDFVNRYDWFITTEQNYNKARCSHVTKRGYTEVLAKPTKPLNESAQASTN